DMSLEEALADLELYLDAALYEEDPQQKKKGGFGLKGGPGGPKADYRNFSPDRKMYAFVKNHNLYLAEADKEAEAVQLTKDGAEDYTFAGGFGPGGAQKGGQKGERKDDAKKDGDRKQRPQLTWSKDSKTFYATRSDTRGVKELFLVNSVANPRPTLLKYKYPMPGEEHVRKSELFVFHKDKNKLVQVERKWRDESYTDLHWGKTSDELP